MNFLKRLVCAGLVASAVVILPIAGRAQSPPPIPVPMELLTGYLFQDTNFLSIWGDQPLSQTNLALVPTWDYYGLQVDSTNAAWLSYGMESEGYPNLYLTNGTLEIWVQPNWISSGLGGTGSGVWSRIIDVGQWTSNASYGWFSLYTDPSGNNLFFSAQTNNGTQTNYLTVPIAWDGTTWHQLILTYSASSTCLYLDGALATNGPGISILPPPEALSNGFYVLSDQTGVQQFHGQADRLWIYGNPETDTNEIASDYAYYNAFANPPPHLGSFGDDFPSPPGDGGGGGGTNSGSGPTADGIYNPPYGSNQFWLQILPYGTNAYNTDTNSVTMILYGTTNTSVYQIWCTTNLTPPVVWSPIDTFYGSTNTNWTVFTISMIGQPTLFFKAVNFSQDTDGEGLPDWWQMKYFGEIGLDPFALDPSGDGLTLWYDFINGLNPTVFNTPPPPYDFSAIMNNASTVTLSWLPSAGAVIGYTIGRYDSVQQIYTNISVGPSNQFVDNSFINYPATDSPISYSIQANFTNGSSGWSASISPTSLNGGPIAQAFATSDGFTVLGITAIPAGAAGLLLTRIDYGDDGITGSNSFYVPVSSFLNGSYTVPTNYNGLGLNGTGWGVQVVWPNGVTNAMAGAGFIEGESYYGYGEPPIPTFNNASTVMEQNIAFLLRAASQTSPFNYVFNAEYGISPVNQPSDYAYEGYWNVNEDTGDGLGDASYLDWALPYQQNFRFCNFVFSTTNIGSNGLLTTGYDPAGYDFGYGVYPYYLQDPLTFVFPFTNNSGLPGLLASNQATWIVSSDNLGIISASNRFFLPTNIYNYYGLKLLSVKLAHEHGSELEIDTLDAGGSVLATNDTYYTYAQYDQPQLQTVGYFFGRTVQNLALPLLTGLISDPLPGDNAFSPTNAQPTIIGAVGNNLEIAAFADQIILNGNTNIPVYVSQYFDKAYKVDSNGNVTTNETGLLSPYGVFMPTEPGPVALVTLPSSDGQRGTCVVQVISLNLDANHDGAMNLSYYGPDYTLNTAWPVPGGRSMQFWVNDGYIQPGNGSTLDQDMPIYPDQTSYTNPSIEPNYAYGQIRCQRNLVNFGRLWLCGLPSLPTNQGYSVTLNAWGPSGINLYNAYESNGGTLYLSDTNVAAMQVGAPYGSNVAQIGGYFTYLPYVLPVNSSGQVSETNFLFEGAGVAGLSDGTGSVVLLLTISQNGTSVAQASAYINFSHTKDLYERAQVTNVIRDWPAMVQQPQTSGVQILNSPGFNYYETNQLALFVHGWKMTAWGQDDFSDTMFKNLYWQGFQGRFASLHWPTRSADTDTNVLFGFIKMVDFTYNRSEHIAFDSGTGAAEYFNYLRDNFPDYTISACAHSMGNVVMMEALTELAASSQSPLDNYVLMQAAVPAHCYDTTVTNVPLFVTEEITVPTPNTYSNYAAEITSGLRGKIVNFFNPEDFALSAWVLNEGFYFNATNNSTNEILTIKPNTFFGYSYNASNGVAQVTSNTWQLVVGVSNVQTRVVSNLFEMMPFVARPRSLAVGAQAGVSNVLSVSQQLNLQTTLGFTGATYDHSGEFNRNIQTPQVQGFYTNLIGTLFPVF